jgi:DNA-directed RNA polymerase subunit alpha
MQPVPAINPALLKKVEEVGLSERTVLVLKNGSIPYIGDLVQRTEMELLRVPHLGGTALYEIKTVLGGMDLHLGMEVRNWPPENLQFPE